MKITLFLNHACNLRCRYCYTGEKFHHRMPISIARQAIDFGLSNADKGFLWISFFGGEPMMEMPLMHSSIDYALDQAQEKKKRVFFSVATNGTLLGAKRLSLLKRQRFNVQVSLDGCQDAQDATRRYANGRSSHHRVVSNLRQLIDEDFNVRVISVIDPANVAFLVESFEHLLSLGVRQIHFAPNYSGPWTDSACERFEGSLRELGERFIARFRTGQDVRLDPLNGKIVTHLAKGYHEKDRCQFGCRELAISPTGKIYPCDRLVGEDNREEICIGSLDRGVDELRRDALILAKNTPDAECASCALQNRCTYWCGCANFETTHNVGQVSPIVCWFERSFIAEADRIANILYQENNPTFLRRFYIPEAPTTNPKQSHTS